MQYTIITLTENKPGILYRMADMFLRRKVNIESLTVSEIEHIGVSRFTIVVNAEADQIDKIVKQLYKIIEVVKVYESTNDQLLYKELAFFKVATDTGQKRRDVEDLARLFNAKIIHVARAHVVIEQTGTEEEVDSLYEMLRPYGMKEFTRSGRIAIRKDPENIKGKFDLTLEKPIGKKTK